MMIIPAFVAFIFLSVVLTGGNFSKRAHAAILLPVFIALTILPALQSGVGTDYETYYEIVRSDSIAFYERRFEYVFVALARISSNLGHPQMLFVLHSFLCMFLLFLFFVRAKGLGVPSTALMLAFLFVTSAYFNQLNALRQYMAAYFLLLFAWDLSRGKKMAFVWASFSVLSHGPSAIIIVLFLFVHRLGRFSSLSIFVASAPAYFIIPAALESFFIYIFPFASAYNTIEFELNYLNLLTKLYYLPLAFALLPRIRSSFGFSNSDAYVFCMRIWAATYFIFLIPLGSDLAVSLRFVHYVVLFYMFPAVVLIAWVNRGRSVLLKLVFWVWFFALPFVKIVLFPSSEYLYKWVL